MFEWAPEIPIFDDMTGNIDEGSYEENPKDNLVE